MRADRISELQSAISFELQKERLRRVLLSDEFSDLGEDVLLSIISSYDKNFDPSLIRSEMSKELDVRKELREPSRDTLFKELEGEIEGLYLALQEPQLSPGKQEEIRAVLRSRQRTFAKAIRSRIRENRNLDPKEGARVLAEARELLRKEKTKVN